MTAELDALVAKLNIGGYARHLFLCTAGACSDEATAARVWQYVKERFAALGLTNAAAFRSKVDCLRVCREGPIALVYPEGTWYRKVDELAAERIIIEHIIGGQPVLELMFASNPLPRLLKVEEEKT